MSEHPDRITVDFVRRCVIVERERAAASYALATPEAFAAASRAWLRCGWEVKYVYTFTWLGRPVIQLPEDLMRAQEAIVAVQPDVIVETGVAHGGSLVFYATVCQALGRGRVIGIDVQIRDGNRRALEAHALAPRIALVEGDSTAPDVVARVRAQVRPGERVLVLLDSAHTKSHVRAELEAYAPLVSVGSYIVVEDAVLEDFATSARGKPDWVVDNPGSAIHEFLERHAEFAVEPPPLPFNESLGLVESVVTYWPGAWLRRRSGPAEA